MLLNTISMLFQLIMVASAPIHAFLEFFLPVLCGVLHGSVVNCMTLILEEWFYHSDYHQSLERIMTKPGIEPVTSCSQVLDITDWAPSGKCGDNYGICPWKGRKYGVEKKAVYQHFLYTY